MSLQTQTIQTSQQLPRSSPIVARTYHCCVRCRSASPWLLSLPSPSSSPLSFNDEFCDCADDTDEPEVQALVMARWGRLNLPLHTLAYVLTPFYYSKSWLGNADCCDGSDEYEGSIICPDTCVMGGNAEYMTINYGSRISNHGSVGAKRIKIRPDGEDSVQKLTGLKVVILVQVVLITVVVAFWLFRLCVKSRRRHYR